MLKNEDYIVHLDEETVLTEDAVKGILNFISDDKHVIGQGIISTSRSNGKPEYIRHKHEHQGASLTNIPNFRCDHLWYSAQPGIFKLVY